MSEPVVIASANAGKIREVQAILKSFLVIPQAEFEVPDVEESAITFVENAILKARNASRYSGLPALADDSGLEVDALGGAPGVFSARYAGAAASDRENLQKLLAELKDVPESERTARFRCVLVYLRHPADPSPVIAEGVWEGAILRQPVGECGFGYDPIFLVPDRGCSSAQLPAREKNALSHRGSALRKLETLLRTHH